MPVVPRYEPSVRLRPAQEQGFSVRASADDFGAAVGRGLGDVASGMNRVAEARIMVEEMEGEAAAKQADNAYAQWEREAMYGPNGFMNLEGQAAVTARAAFEKEAAAKRQEFGQGLTGFGSQAYGRASEVRLNSILDRTIQHQAGERKAWFKQASSDRIDTFANDALAGFKDPKIVTRNIAAGQAELRSMAAMSGWDADTLAARESEFVSGVHKNVALRLAQTDPLAAQKYMEDNKSFLSGKDATDLEGVLAPVIIDQQARQEAERIIGAGRTSQGTFGANVTLGASGNTRALDFLQSRAVGGATRADALVNLDANFATNVAAIIEDAPPSIKDGLGLTSAYRTTEKQAELFAGSGGSGRVAKPGGSSHEYGLAVDMTWNGKLIREGEVPQEVIDYLHGNAHAYGLNFRLKDAAGDLEEDWHVEPLGARDRIRTGNVPVTGTSGGAATVSARGTGVSVGASLPSATEMQSQLDAISNPALREETARRLKLIADLRKADSEAQFQRLKTEAFALIDQGQSPDAMAPEMRAMLGREEMSGLWSYYEARSKAGGIKTDDRTLYDLQTQFATDPARFAQEDLWDYRSKLSDADWEKVNGWRQTALTDQRKAGEEATTIISTSDYMRQQLEAVGITTTDKKGNERAEAARREAEFQIALQREVDAWVKANGKQPLPTDVQGMVDRLLLPVVISEPGKLWGTSETPARMFEVPNLGQIGGERTAQLFQAYEEIPQADRIQIEVALEQVLGYKPSEEQVEAEYARYLNTQFNSGQ